VAGILPAVEGGILPPGRTVRLEQFFTSSNEVWLSCVFPAGQDARLNGRQDACHYRCKPTGNRAKPARKAETKKSCQGNETNHGLTRFAHQS